MNEHLGAEEKLEMEAMENVAKVIDFLKYLGLKEITMADSVMIRRISREVSAQNVKLKSDKDIPDKIKGDLSITSFVAEIVYRFYFERYGIDINEFANGPSGLQLHKDICAMINKKYFDQE